MSRKTTTRRGRGEGGISLVRRPPKNGKGSIEFWRGYTIAIHNGKPKRKYCFAHTKDELLAKLDEVAPFVRSEGDK